MTATTGTVKAVYTSATGHERAVVSVRTHKGWRDAVVALDRPLKLGEDVTLNHGHDDVYTLTHEPDVQGSSVTLEVAIPQVEDPVAAREMVKQLIAAFGPCETRVVETRGDGTKWVVASNVPSEKARIAWGGTIRR
jgi:hypothetical protein